MVCFQHLHPMHIGPESKCWKRENHWDVYIVVEFSNLTFGLETDITRIPNVKFIPLDGSNSVCDMPDPVDTGLDDVAVLQPDLRVKPEADTGRCARRDDVAGLDGHAGR